MDWVVRGRLIRKLRACVWERDARRECSLKCLSSTFLSLSLALSRLFSLFRQYLAALASNGMVVAAVEHRDGSGPSTTIHHPRSASGKAREETLVYFRHEELE